MKKIIEIPWKGDERFKRWIKTVESVNISKANGYAFEGRWLQFGKKAELEIGSLILCYRELGTRKNHEPKVTVFRVEEDGRLSSVLETTGWSWALDLRDRVAEILAENKKDDLSDLEKALAALRKILQESSNEPALEALREVEKVLRSEDLIQ